MKKFFFAGVLEFALTISAVFADHPDGWGIGVMGRGGWGYGHGGLGGAALSLKAPFPVYWGINLDLGSNYFGLGLTGDYYLIDKQLADFGGPSLGWYLGIGGFLGYGTYNSSVASWTSLSLGARVPIGLSFQIPVSSISLEFFGALTPNLGFGFWFWDSKYNDYWKDEANIRLVGGIGGELGLRIWF
jgi:hypothetical protein